MSSNKSPKKPKKPKTPKSEHWKTFRRGLKPLLREKGRTQVDLAKRLGVEPQRITAWLREPEGPDDEDRTPNIEYVLEIADFLEVSLDRVMGRIPPGCDLLEQLYQHHHDVAQALKQTLPVRSENEDGGTVDGGITFAGKKSRKKPKKKPKSGSKKGKKKKS